MKSRIRVRPILFMVLLVVAVLLTGIIAKFFRTAAAADVAYPNLVYPNPGITATQGLRPDILANCDIVFADRNSLPPGEKQAMEEARYQICIHSLPPSRVTPDIIPTVGPSVLANVTRRTAGLGTIIEDGQAPLPSMSYLGVNGWYRQTSNETLMVFAGAKIRDDFQGHRDTLQGVLEILALTPDGKFLPSERGEYVTPIALGPVRIVDAQGEQLTLVAPDGTGFFFNVASRKFIFPGPPAPVVRLSGSGKVIETGTTRLTVSARPFENQWTETKGDSQVTVLAGADQAGGAQGMVTVVVTSKNNPNQIIEELVYPAPYHFGSFRIVDASGERLTLATHGGDIFVFDVSLRRYVSWPEVPPEMASTQTPIPLITTTNGISSPTLANP